MPTIRARCEEIGRDPQTLKLSVHVWWEQLDEPTGAQRIDMVAGYRELGVSRVIGMIRGSVESNEALASWAEDCRAGGASLVDSVEIGS